MSGLIPSRQNKYQLSAISFQLSGNREQEEQEDALLMAVRVWRPNPYCTGLDPLSPAEG